jgi:protein-tyrosine-phosphatase
VQRATLLHRDAFRRILPLKEAAERMAKVPDRKIELDRFIEEINGARDPTSYLASRWDVADPYRRKLKEYRRAVGEISSLVDVVLGRLA